MFLASTSDIIRVVTGSAVSTISVHADWVDNATGTYTPGKTNTAITTATTTTVVGSPAASTVRNARNILINNNNATASCVVTVQHFDGTTSIDIAKVTLKPGEQLLRDERGDWRHQSDWGSEYDGGGLAIPNLGITGTVAETMPREFCTETNVTGPSSGTLWLQAVYLKAGQVVTNISFFSATTAAGTPTNQFFALYGSEYNLLAQSANDTTAAWAANTIKTLAMTTPYTVPVSRFYHVGVMVAATTVPTFKGQPNRIGGTLSGRFPVLSGTSNTALTTTLPITANTPSTAGNTFSFWAAIT